MVSASDTWGSGLDRLQQTHVHVSDKSMSSDEREQIISRLNQQLRHIKVFAGRPNLSRLFQRHLRSCLSQEADFDNTVGTSTLVTFCGSPFLGSCVSREIDEITLLSTLTNNTNHNFTFTQENYGQGTSQVKRHGFSSSNETAKTDLEKGETDKAVSHLRHGSFAVESRNVSVVVPRDMPLSINAQMDEGGDLTTRAAMTAASPSVRKLAPSTHNLRKTSNRFHDVNFVYDK